MTVINQVLMGGLWLCGSYMIVLAMTVLLVGSTYVPINHSM